MDAQKHFGFFAATAFAFVFVTIDVAAVIIKGPRLQVRIQTSFKSKFVGMETIRNRVSACVNWSRDPIASQSQHDV